MLLPNMSSQRLLQLDRNLLAQLVADTSGATLRSCHHVTVLKRMHACRSPSYEVGRPAGVARRLVGLQALFPGADIAKLVSKR